jgi:16S rRNA (guanine966-N2)-methyltransferase
MRIITGIAKGRQIKIPKDINFRPTSDKVRETLFNVLADRTAGCVFLDCFSGSGAVGLEGASRSASKIICIEKDRRNCALIKENFQNLGFISQLDLIEDDYIHALSVLGKNGIKPDIMFFDPPYHAGIYDRLLDFLSGSPIILNGLIIIEHFKKIVIPYEPIFETWKVSKSGDTYLTYLQKKHSHT